MKILNSHQIKEADRSTIIHEPISSLDLMERAGQRIFDKIIVQYSNCDAFAIFCGPGNNGGDGHVIARMLKESGKTVEVLLLKGNYTDELKVNFEKVKSLDIPCRIIEDNKQVNNLFFEPFVILIDALFGVGISRPLEGIASALVSKINTLTNYKVAIDLPSGMSPDNAFVSTLDNTVKVDRTFSIQLPKLAFMFEENNFFTGQFEYVDIGISQAFIDKQDTPYVYADEKLIKSLIRPRQQFGHKGTFGHTLIIAGSEGKSGAALLSCKAALKTGCGLLTALIPESAVVPLNCFLPEAMVFQTGDNIRNDYSAFNAVGFGPGVGKSDEACNRLFELLNLYHLPLVIDADGLNCLSANPTWYGFLKSNIVLTPHPGEFDRLTRKHETTYERYLTQQHFSKKHQVTVVLKGHHTSVTTPSGLTFFNSTGNNGMATAGSGDVLIGIITSLCAQGYSPEDAAVMGVYLHGFAGDEASKQVSKTALIASDIINGIGAFFRLFEN